MSKTEKPAVVPQAAGSKAAKPVEAVVYLGPAIPKLVSHGTVFSDGKIPAYLEAMAKKIPAIRGLIVPVSRYAEAAKELRSPGRLKTLYDTETGLLLFSYDGQDKVLLNDIPILPGAYQVWLQSSVLKGMNSNPVYYSSIIACYQKEHDTTQAVTFCGRDINFRFPNSDNGMHDLSFTLCNGELLAIMGGSGTGKTTLLSLLNGTLTPQQGTITINGHSITEPAAKALIGFVPQDDLLIEELTVYQNLWYTAKFCFEGMSDEDLDRRVMKTLKDLGLDAAKDLKVGSPIHKFISGGQRKRLNIALELIREPAVLFLDEPTSGLSSADT